MTLREASGSRDALYLINPYRFREPLAPMVAAEVSGRQIEMRILRERFDHLADRHRVILVEGAGGLMAPITDTESFLDVAGFLRLPLLVVIGSRLGALNHARLTVEAALQVRLPVAGAILNHPNEDRSPARRTNLSALRRILPVPVLAEIPHCSAGERKPPWKDLRLQRLLAGCLPRLLPNLCKEGQEI